MGTLQGQRQRRRRVRLSIRGLTEATADAGARIEVEGRQIRIGINPDSAKDIEARVPLGRGGTPDEAAGAIYLFCIPESNYVSGQVLVVGGGQGSG